MPTAAVGAQSDSTLHISAGNWWSFLDFQLIFSIMEFIEGLKQHQLYKQFDVWAEKTSTEILTWAHPDLDLAARPESVRNAPLASFQAMFAFVILYAIIVFVGMVLYKKPKASAGGKRETPSWDVVLASFKKEPVKIFQAIYNVVQVSRVGRWALISHTGAELHRRCRSVKFRMHMVPACVRWS